MSRFKIGVPLLALAVALGSTGAAFAAEHEHENGQEITAALAAKTNLSQAIASAEQKTGGQALRVSFEEHDGSYVYVIKMITKDTVSDVSVDPTSGRVLRTEADGLISRIFDGDDRADAAKLKDAHTTLASAIAAAEHQAGGKAIEAGFESEDGQVQFQVSVAKGHTVSDVKVDGATGKVTKIQAAGDSEGDEGEHDED